MFAVLKMNRAYPETTSRENYCVPGTKETRDKDDEQIIFRRNLERRLFRGTVEIDNISVVVSGFWQKGACRNRKLVTKRFASCPQHAPSERNNNN